MSKIGSLSAAIRPFPGRRFRCRGTNPGPSLSSCVSGSWLRFQRISATLRGKGLGGANLYICGSAVYGIWSRAVIRFRAGVLFPFIS